jgi:hypothetical protein
MASAKGIENNNNNGFVFVEKPTNSLTSLEINSADFKKWKRILGNY